MFKKVDVKQSFPKMEEEILKFWEEEKIFEKSLEKTKGGKPYTFYDGPPFATGTPHHGHIVGSVMKDVVPRFWTMKGRYVERKWGWDCHGLPIENIAEKELGFKHKKDIEEYGVDKFNEFCRSKVLGYVDDWKKVINRLGRWADMENAYKTMDLKYMESVWWVFKELWDKGLIYEGYRSMHICTRCETTLSQQEVSEGYKDIKDLSVVAKFELASEPGTFVLAWTTTPWTLIGNVALAVGREIDYVKVKVPNKSKKVFLISGKYAFASKDYFPKLKMKLEGEGYDVTVIDHVNSASPLLSENLAYFKKFDFSQSNIVTHSLGASTFLRFLSEENITVETLTMIAPSYPGRSVGSTDEKWIKESGYDSMDINVKAAKEKITGGINIIYSDDEVLRVQNIELLGKDISATMFKEENKKHFFGKKYTLEPNYVFDFNEYYICAKALVEKVFTDKKYRIISEFRGSDLIGKSYKPLFDYYQTPDLENAENGWKIYAGDFVTTEDGVGVVHIAPAFGEDDMNLGKQYSLPFIQHVKMDGTIKEQAVDFAGMNVKSLEDHMQTDIEIIKYLAKKDTLFSKEKYEHSYPHCWRCDTPLINYATTSWFVNVGKVKERALELAKEITWFPAHIKDGRFGKWLEGARDWSISRQRFWASVMPIWKCECGEMKVFGSVSELENLSGQKVSDLHKHIVDSITVPCEKCGGAMKRVPDVLDTWFDSGSMPYAQQHYPFENQEKFENGFPAEFIAEGVDQTRAWFYYLHLIATAIKDKNAFNNVIVNGIVLAEDGKKMSKRLQNYPDPTYLFDKYGADALRFYLMSSPVVAADNLNFKESDVSDLVRGMFRMLWNSYSFFALYANIDGFDPKKKNEKSENLLDKWILSELHILIKEVNENMEKYDLTRTARLFPKFIDNLSNWYIRRSRKRFWKSENDSDKDFAYQTLHTVLVELSKLMAPFTPFMSEEIYKNLTDETSVHLAEFPVADESLIDEKLNNEMEIVREVINQGLAIRSEQKIKVRQPLLDAMVNSIELSGELKSIICEELNIKNIESLNKIELDKKLVDDLTSETEGTSRGRYALLNDKERKFGSLSDRNALIALNIEITPELKLEGQAREIVRFIQEMRKEAGYEVDNRIVVEREGMDEVFGDENCLAIIKHETLANSIEKGSGEGFDLKKELEVDGMKVLIAVKK